MKKAKRQAPAINTEKLYTAFIAAAEKKLGPRDDVAIHAIFGFDLGGPPDILMFPKAPDSPAAGIYYVTSDLIFQKAQPANSLGKYELAMCVKKKDARWAQNILYKLAWFTMESVFDHGHTIDITAWVDKKCPFKGLVLTRLFATKNQNQRFGALLCAGLTRAELDYAREHTSTDLLTQLQATNNFPLTDPKRRSII